MFERQNLALLRMTHDHGLVADAVVLGTFSTKYTVVLGSANAVCRLCAKLKIEIKIGMILAAT